MGTVTLDFRASGCYEVLNPKPYSKSQKVGETGLRTISAGIPYTLLLRIEAIGFPTFGHLPLTLTAVDDINPALP